MKILKLKLFFALLVLASLGLKAQQVKLAGRVLHKEDNLKGAEIKVIANDSVYEVTNTNHWGNFKVKLPLGRIYELEISKEKYVTKTILLTAITDDSKKKAAFEFDVELLKKKEFRYVSLPKEQEPVAHIYYDTKDNELDWDRDVSRKAKKITQELKQANKEKRYEKYSRF